MIVVQKDKFSPLEHYNTLGYIIICISVIGIYLLSRVSRMVKRKSKESQKEKEQTALAVKEADLLVE